MIARVRRQVLLVAIERDFRGRRHIIGRQMKAPVPVNRPPGVPMPSGLLTSFVQRDARQQTPEISRVQLVLPLRNFDSAMLSKRSHLQGRSAG